MFQVFLYLITLPSNLVGWLLVTILGLAWGNGLRWKDWVLTTTLKPGSWPMTTWFKNWGGSTTGHAVFLAPMNEYEEKLVWSHELVHVEQIQGRALAGVIVALCVVGWSWWMALILWALMPPIVYLCSGLVALMRGEHFYQGNHEEESANSQEHL